MDIKQKKKHNAEDSLFKDLFSEIELQFAIDKLKNRNTVDINDVYIEQIKHFMAMAKKWLLDFFKNITSSQKIYKIWKKSKITQLLKPKRTFDDPKKKKLIHFFSLLFI